MLVSLNKGTVAMLVSPTNPLGIEVTDHLSENTIESTETTYCNGKHQLVKML